MDSTCTSNNKGHLVANLYVTILCANFTHIIPQCGSIQDRKSFLPKAVHQKTTCNWRKGEILRLQLQQAMQHLHFGRLIPQSKFQNHYLCAQSIINHQKRAYKFKFDSVLSISAICPYHHSRSCTQLHTLWNYCTLQDLYLHLSSYLL